MKKLIVTSILLVFSIATTGCEQKPAEPAAVVETTLSESVDNIHQTKDYSFSIPESWKGKFLVVPSSQGEVFYSAGIHKINSSGRLCEIVSTRVDREWEQYPDYKYLGSSDGVFFFMTYPTDVQFDVDNEDLATEYMKMKGDISQIENTFKLIGKSVSYEEPANQDNVVAEAAVPFDMKYVGDSINTVVEDAKYTGGIVLTYPEQSVLPYLKSFEPIGGEQYCIYSPENSTGRDSACFAVVDGVITAAGFLMDDSTANVYQLIKDTPFKDVEPRIIDIGTEGTVKDLVWKIQDGFFNIRAMPAGNDNYKGWVVITYCLRNH